MKELVIDKQDKILIIAPHPDDESIGCGGLLLKYGNQCDVVCLTDGRQGQGDVTPCRLAKIRKYEFVEAMKNVGLKNYKMLNIEDGTLCAHLFCLNDIDISIYTKIFVTGRSDNHPDHTASLVCLMNAIEMQNIEQKEIYEYEVHHSVSGATHYLDITDVIEKKSILIGIYKSQIKNFPFDKKILEMNLKNGNEEYYFENYKRINIKTVDANICIERELEKSREFYWIYTRWMNLIQNGRCIKEYFKEDNKLEIIIYGYKEIGKLLEREMINEGCTINYVIDNSKKVKDDYPQKEIISAEESTKYKCFDNAVIVTATFYYKDIEETLEKLGYTNIHSLKRILEELESGEI
ncbi:PIG-L deacetylase family protein [Pseudobutyrivibrio xylanivorans]|uniref:N-acetylglucosaminyl deacetylase n=1 Tax=Pseudobutyrivibrio xylanivorans TaxID=185007 RepID=A0A5P6VQV2_PSEXY|nr:PIG-L deacetylase family protein [Pseudobutyrivibrio xylanivorans]QFJ54987.1 N-acetylglucosaminyl deacetylase [Pseudobutyrivibrio xylanivorans]